MKARRCQQSPCGFPIHPSLSCSKPGSYVGTWGSSLRDLHGRDRPRQHAASLVHTRPGKHQHLSPPASLRGAELGIALSPPCWAAHPALLVPQLGQDPTLSFQSYFKANLESPFAHVSPQPSPLPSPVPSGLPGVVPVWLYARGCSSLGERQGVHWGTLDTRCTWEWGDRPARPWKNSSSLIRLFPKAGKK